MAPRGDISSPAEMGGHVSHPCSQQSKPEWGFEPLRPPDLRRGQTRPPTALHALPALSAALQRETPGRLTRLYNFPKSDINTSNNGKKTKITSLGKRGSELLNDRRAREEITREMRKCQRHMKTRHVTLAQDRDLDERNGAVRSGAALTLAAGGF